MKVSVSISIEVEDLRVFETAKEEIRVRENRKLSFSVTVVELARLGFARKKELWSKQSMLVDTNMTEKPRPKEEEIPKRAKKKQKK